MDAQGARNDEYLPLLGPTQMIAMSRRIFRFCTRLAVTYCAVPALNSHVRGRRLARGRRRPRPSGWLCGQRGSGGLDGPGSGEATAGGLPGGSVLATCQSRGWREREPADALAAAAWALAHGIAVLRTQGSLARHYPDPSLSGVGQLVTALTATAERRRRRSVAAVARRRNGALSTILGSLPVVNRGGGCRAWVPYGRTRRRRR